MSGIHNSYIQTNFINGSDVTWGSSEVLHPNVTVRQIEELASYVAASVYKKVSEKWGEVQHNSVGDNLLDSPQKVDCLVIHSEAEMKQK